jgi:glucose/arabinose dehydrogenase
MRRALLAALPLTVAGALTGCDQSDPDPVDDAGSARGLPALGVTTVVNGLDHPWDVRPLGHGRLLVSERDRARLSIVAHGRRHTVAFPSRRIWVSGETGLLGLAVDPAFGSNHRIYTCQGWLRPDGGHDVRAIAWHLDLAARKATRIKTLVGGFPTSSGRHGGCRLLIARNGALLVGTGDAAQGTNPEDLHSLGGKTLRLDRFTGRPWPGNRFAHAADPHKRYLHTWGHRNVQGLAQRADGTLWSVEHGPDRDDEVNLLRNGHDYGWNPVPGYNESVPMTDHSLPGPQTSARWSSGFPTLATSGAAWVPAQGWGRYGGALAVAVLKSERVLFLRFDARGHFRSSVAPAVLQTFGRLRTVTALLGGDLLVTTDNGNGADRILRVRPRG